jgi:hypothetical protein
VRVDEGTLHYFISGNLLKLMLMTLAYPQMESVPFTSCTVKSEDAKRKTMLNVTRFLLD